MENEFNYRNNKKRTLKPWQGILLFLLVMLSYYTIITWVQLRFGMFGLALIEAYLLLLSVGFAVLCKANLREVFPLKKPNWMGILGTLLLWAGSYSLLIPITMTITYFFPRQMYAVSGSLNDTLNSVPLFLTVLIAAVMPAICEEALHRGVILHSMKSLKKDWLIVLVMGILFGLFHGNIWRFLPTALLGGALSYLMLKTENMVYPALFHFTNNFLPSLLSLLLALSGTNNDVSAETMTYLMENGIPLATLGIYVAMGCAAPFALYTAAYLIKRSQGRKTPYFPKKSQPLRITALVLLTMLPLITGGLLFIYGLLYDNNLWNYMNQIQGSDNPLLHYFFSIQ